MSQNNSNDKLNSLNLIASINQVEGFDPSIFAVDYTDLNTNEVRKRLPIMPLLAWFRLKYPEGKIAVTTKPGKDCFEATARIYPNYKDSPENYIGEASASRGYCADKPSVSPREWAQTAAIGIALRNAGFGLQFGMVGDDFSNVTSSELNGFEDIDSAEQPDNSDTEGASALPVAEREMTLEERATAAMSLPCPIKRYQDKTLGEVLSLDPKALTWLCEKYNDNPKIKSGAIAICEYAMQQTTT